MVMFVSSGKHLTMSCYYIVIDWLRVCRGESETKLRTRKWKAFLFGLPWAYGLTFAAASRSVIDPSELPMCWYC